MPDFKNINILICVTGGIAAYKSAEIIRLFKKDSADVRVVMTEAAKEFITPLTLQAVSGNEIHDALIDQRSELAMGHIELAKWADIILIAPCTADSLSKITHGRADDLMGALILASEAKTYIAPAMNTNMWMDSATQSNFNKLLDRDINFIGPAFGEQACGDIGPGRMEEPTTIHKYISDTYHNKLLSGLTLTITAGPTREQIDPVRYISNNSSGKMGYSLAEEAIKYGATVNLISGPVALSANQDINLIKVNSADEMLDSVNKYMPNSDIFIGCAAVVDFKPENYSDTKIKKENKTKIDIKLRKNEDILKEVSKNYPNSYCVGFAAETSNVVNYAKEKLVSKNLDMIVSNDISNKSIGFDADYNEVNVITKDSSIFLERDKKFNIAKKILEIIKTNI